MDHLTSRRVNGIKSGYWTTASKEDVVQKLGRIEELGRYLIFSACTAHCHMQVNADECNACPLRDLEKMIDG